MTYLIKIILCSGLFFLVYFIFLEKEKMYRFNRFYLLCSFAFSLIVPLINFNLNVEKETPLQTVSNYVFSPGQILPEDISLQIIKPAKNVLSIQEFLLLIYCLISIFFLILFAKNLIKIYSKIKGKKYLLYKGGKVILTEENLTPHSFLSWIFLNKTAFEKGSIEEEILCHELTHINQYHTIDVLVIEFAKAFLWFNPFVFLYGKAIKLNHEFLADEGVINKFQNITAYQYLLVEKTSQQSAFAITSQFNFLITKKRLIMISKYTSPRIAFLKQCLVVVFFTIAIFSFSAKYLVAQKIHTQQPISKSSPPQKDSVKIFHFGNYAGGTNEGVAPEMLSEYQDIINRTKTPEMDWFQFIKAVPLSDKKRLEYIFMQMNIDQQEQETVVFLKPFKPLPRTVPTEKQFEAFKNGKIYGVWINEKKVGNSELNNYVAKDFAQVFISKLSGGAKKNKSYFYQVNMMTRDYYQAYYNRTIADKSNLMVFQGRKKVKK